MNVTSHTVADAADTRDLFARVHRCRHCLQSRGHTSLLNVQVIRDRTIAVNDGDLIVSSAHAVVSVRRNRLNGTGARREHRRTAGPAEIPRKLLTAVRSVVIKP